MPEIKERTQIATITTKDGRKIKTPIRIVETIHEDGRKDSHVHVPPLDLTAKENK